MNKIKIQIKSLAGSILFEYEKENNTVKDTLKKAIEEGADLTGADLTGANLTRANLYGANLTGADLYGANLYGADLTGANLTRANLYGANLYGANFYGADLYGANLTGADLYGANLYGANLYGANLTGADLTRADLTGADLTGANLYGANLTGADLTGADLTGANLTRANLTGADLTGAKENPYIPLNCPSEGAFIGWKKVRGCLVKLEIPEDAQRLSSVSMKCRCDKAKVLSVLNLNTEKELSEIINSAYNHETIYKVGEMVYPDAFDENRWNECSNGIHFFINKQDAINY